MESQSEAVGGVTVTCSPADPVYERVGSLSHRRPPLKLELSSSSHTYSSLKSEEGDYTGE